MPNGSVGNTAPPAPNTIFSQLLFGKNEETIEFFGEG